MPRVTLQSVTIERLEILSAAGAVDNDLLPKIDDATLVSMHQSMIRMRAFDEKALNLQRQGRMGTYGSMRGQEAAQAGLAAAIEPTDWIVPSFRDQGVLEARGIPMHLWYAFCKGDERSSLYPQGTRCLPPAIPVGSQLLHAAGIGMGLALDNKPHAAVGLAGDGATSEGDFHEALNFAGVFKARTVFYIQNNQWAISVPFSKQTASATVAQKAVAYGIPGIQVDGNDVLAVYAACTEALNHARQGTGPYLIEALTYRLGSHTTADDASRYRNQHEVDDWADRDPIERMGRFLSSRGLWSDAADAAYRAELADVVEAEVARLEAMGTPPATDIFDHMFADLPPNLVEQRSTLNEEACP